MSTQSSAMRSVILSFALVLFLTSCSKEKAASKRVTFIANASTWYRIAPTDPAPISGTNYFTFAYVPGGGQGNATHMGNVKTYFNQLAYASVFPPPPTPPSPEGSLVASVIDVINYPIFGAPLPLIQEGDFDGLAAIHASLNIPPQVNGKVVSSFFYNDKGDAVFISNATASVITAISETRNEFSGKALIVSGRGKFAGAIGEVDFSGSFNPGNPNEADYRVEGWISY